MPVSRRRAASASASTIENVAPKQAAMTPSTGTKKRLTLMERQAQYSARKSKTPARGRAGSCGQVRSARIARSKTLSTRDAKREAAIAQASSVKRSTSTRLFSATAASAQKARPVPGATPSRSFGGTSRRFAGPHSLYDKASKVVDSVGLGHAEWKDIPGGCLEKTEEREPAVSDGPAFCLEQQDRQFPIATAAHSKRAAPAGNAAEPSKKPARRAAAGGKDDDSDDDEQGMDSTTGGSRVSGQAVDDRGRYDARGRPANDTRDTERVIMEQILRKTEAEHKAKLEAALKEQEDRLTAAQEELRQRLEKEKQAQRADAEKEMQKIIAECQEAWVVMQGFRKEIKLGQERVSELESHLQREKERHDMELAKRLSDLQKQHADELSRRESLFELQKATLRTQVERQLNEEILSNNKHQSSQWEEKQREHQRAMQQLGDRLQREHSTAVDALRDELKTKERQAVMDATKKWQAMYEQSEHRLEEQRREVQSLQGEVQRLRDRCAELNNARAAEQRSSQADFSAQLQSAEAEAAAAQAEAQRLRAEASDARTKLLQCESTIEELRGAEQRLSAELVEQREAARARSSIATLSVATNTSDTAGQDHCHASPHQTDSGATGTSNDQSTATSSSDPAAPAKAAAQPQDAAVVSDKMEDYITVVASRLGVPEGVLCSIAVRSGLMEASHPFALQCRREELPQVGVCFGDNCRVAVLDATGAAEALVYTLQVSFQGLCWQIRRSRQALEAMHKSLTEQGGIPEEILPALPASEVVAVQALRKEAVRRRSSIHDLFTPKAKRKKADAEPCNAQGTPLKVIADSVKKIEEYLSELLNDFPIDQVLRWLQVMSCTEAICVQILQQDSRHLSTPIAENLTPRTSARKRCNGGGTASAAQSSTAATTSTWEFKLRVSQHGKIWTIDRTYSQLVALHEAVLRESRGQASAGTLPALPPSGCTPMQIQTYLDSVNCVVNDRLRSTFCGFLEVEETK